MTQFVLIALGILIAVLTVVSCFGWLPSLRIVPDDTHFDFTRFRRISFPISALLSILAITLFFTHGLNFGIDFKGGTLMEVKAKTGVADIASMRQTLDDLIDTLDQDAPWPGEPAEGQRGRAGSPRRVALPEGWLDSQELNEASAAVVAQAELSVSGG